MALLVCGVALAAPQANAAALEITHAQTGDLITRIELPDPAEWCVVWNHSVKGFQVTDCYAAPEGQMTLIWSHLPDFAAGLGHIIGRGRQVSDGAGGYIIEDINEAVPGNAYILRAGSMAVDHRIRAGETVISLSRLAARAPLRIAYIP